MYIGLRLGIGLLGEMKVVRFSKVRHSRKKEKLKRGMSHLSGLGGGGCDGHEGDFSSLLNVQPTQPQSLKKVKKGGGGMKMKFPLKQNSMYIHLYRCIFSS